MPSKKALLLTSNLTSSASIWQECNHYYNYETIFPNFINCPVGSWNAGWETCRNLAKRQDAQHPTTANCCNDSRSQHKRLQSRQKQNALLGMDGEARQSQRRLYDTHLRRSIQCNLRQQPHTTMDRAFHRTGLPMCQLRISHPTTGRTSNI